MADGDLYAGFMVGNKPLSSLRVIDLKSELEKRGLSKSGSKKDLLERLKRQLQLEKLQESAQRNADRVPNLSLQDDDIGSQNEVVKQYLAAQQKTYELQKEARRQIELSADEVGVSDTDASSSQDEGHTPLKLKVPSHRNKQAISELKESEVVSSEVEEPEDFSKNSETNPSHLRSHLVKNLVEPKELPKDIPVQVEKQNASEVVTKISDPPKAAEKHDETPIENQAPVADEAENLTMKHPPIETAKDEPMDVSVAAVDNAEEVNRLVSITETEMASAIESISGLAEPSYAMEATEEPTSVGAITENTKKPPDEVVAMVENPESEKIPDEDLIAKAEPATEPDKEMVKANKVSPAKKTEKVEKDIPSKDSKNTSELTKSKVKAENAEQPMDLSFDDGQTKAENITKDDEKEKPLEKESQNGAPVKTEKLISGPQLPRERKHSSDTESQGSDKRSRSRSGSSDSRSSGASFHSGSGSYSSPLRKKRIRNTDSEASSSSEDENEPKRRSKSDTVPSKSVNKSEPSSKDLPVSTSKRRKWTNSSVESNSTEERRKITRNNTIPVVENKDVVKIESEDAEDVGDKKDTLVLDLHATDETMGVSDTEKELIETKPTASKPKSEAIEEKEQEKEKKVLNRRKLSLSGSTEKYDEDKDKPKRKRKWGSISKVVPASSPVISTESLKELIPDLTPALTAAAKMDDIVIKAPVMKENVSNNVQTPNKIEIKNLDSEEKSGLPREISPARKPVSAVLYIRNLVRPFTLNQLKEELGKTGTMIEDGFWIDKIKSKCYVTYETEDQAAETRLALHGSRWPVSNPKTLFVDFSNVEELEFHKGGAKPPPVPPPKAEVPREHHPRESVRKISESGATTDRPRRISADEKKGVDRERNASGRSRTTSETSHQNTSAHPIREWDRDKIMQDESGRRFRDQDRSRRSRENDKPRSKERKDRKDRKVESKKKQEEERPGKLLDDLFRKTKTMPCIYWLPLTDQQIVQRDELRKQRLLEREKRRQRLEQEERERIEAERKMRLKERDTRIVRDRNASRRSRSMSRSPVRRR